jgi:hypothetical protein
MKVGCSSVDPSLSHHRRVLFTRSVKKQDLFRVSYNKVECVLVIPYV